jgi:hypothetical protein
MPNGRCKVHGGKSTGPRTPEGLERSRRANWKHGHFSREAKAERSRVRAAILALRQMPKFFSRPFIASATKLKVRPITVEVHDASEIENAVHPSTTPLPPKGQWGASKGQRRSESINSGQIVGAYTDGTGDHGFLYKTLSLNLGLLIGAKQTYCERIGGGVSRGGSHAILRTVGKVVQFADQSRAAHLQVIYFQRLLGGRSFEAVGEGYANADRFRITK